MKKTITTLAMALTVNAFAQIPNSGFENWTTVGSYMDPQGYLTPNSYSSGSFYPVTRDTSHYPASVGNYSIKIENNPSLSMAGYGVVLQNTHGSMTSGPGAYFPIIGHPTSLTGYYKYTPQNNDTMMIMVQLSYGGSNVSFAMLTSTVTVSNWTSFSLPLGTYTNADSGTIILAAYSAGPNAYNVPHGNSVLNVDNLNFDNLITGIEQVTGINNQVKIYPNPASTSINLTISQFDNLKMNSVEIFNMLGESVHYQILKSSNSQIDVSDLSEGVYTISITSNEGVVNKRLVIVR